MKPPDASRRTRGQPMRRRRQKKTRRRRVWRSLITPPPPLPQLAVLIVILAGLYSLATSRVFAITTVQAIGNPALENVFRRACGCVGANIFLTQPEAIRSRLDQIAWVDVQHVYARLPDRIVVDATYRRPALLWRTSVTTYTVDASGVVLYDLHNPPVAPSMVPTTATLPLVFSPHDSTFSSGQQIPLVAAQMVLATRADLARPIAPSVDRYRWSPYSGLTGHSRLGGYNRLGWWFTLGIYLNDDLRVRLQALEQAFDQGDLNRCNYVDLRPMPNIYCNYQWQWHGPWGPGSQ